MSETEIVDDTLEEKTPTEEELDDFKNKMAEWLKMDEQINKSINYQLLYEKDVNYKMLYRGILRILCLSSIITMYL